MSLCIGERIDGPDWAGLPLARFTPPDRPRLSQAFVACQNTLFVWRGDAVLVTVVSRGGELRYARREGVLDIMAIDDEVFIIDEAPGQDRACLLVTLSPEVCAPFDRGLYGRVELRSRFGIVDPLLYELAARLERHCVEGQPLGSIYSESLSAALVAHVSVSYGEPVGMPHPGPKPADAGQLTAAQQGRVYRFIDEHLGGDIPLRDLAALVDYSPTHFMRLFRQSFGRSPHQFVLQMRIDRAMRLLRGDQQSLAQIAAACGFADQSHFGSAFAKASGLSPGRYRAKTRRKI